MRVSQWRMHLGFREWLATVERQSLLKRVPPQDGNLQNTAQTNCPASAKCKQSGIDS